MANTFVPNYRFTVYVHTISQLEALGELSAETLSGIIRVYIYSDLIMRHKECESLCRNLLSKNSSIELDIALPEIIRLDDSRYLKTLLEKTNSDSMFSGFLISNLEGLGFLQSYDYKGKIYSDHSFYLWNKVSYNLWADTFSGCCIPLELKASEQHALLRDCKAITVHQKSSAVFGEMPVWEKIVYGHIPMMLSANCVARTAGKCQKNNPESNKNAWTIADRKNISFPVVTNCEHCFNIIYNSLPLSLHSELEKWKSEANYRLQFTIETKKVTGQILDFFVKHGGAKEKLPLSEYTTGHEKRGVQ